MRNFIILNNSSAEVVEALNEHRECSDGNESNEGPRDISAIMDYQADEATEKTPTFSRDFSSVIQATPTGYRIFQFADHDELVPFCKNELGDCLIAKRLYSGALVAVVTHRRADVLSLYHCKKNKLVCSYTYKTIIRAVHMNEQYLAVCTRETIHLHTTAKMTKHYSMTDTIQDCTDLLCDLACPDEMPCLVAYATSKVGALHVFDTKTKERLLIQAHEDHLQCLRFNQQGTMLATTCVQGKVIYVFDVTPEAKGCKLRGFFRGLKPTTVCCMSFSLDSLFLVVASNTKTVHVFKMAETTRMTEVTPESTWGYSAMNFIGSAAAATSSHFIPGSVLETAILPDSHFKIRLPFEDLEPQAALTRVDGDVRVIIATKNNVVSSYNFIERKGGNVETPLLQRSLNAKCRGSRFFSNYKDLSGSSASRQFTMWMNGEEIRYDSLEAGYLLFRYHLRKLLLPNKDAVLPPAKRGSELTVHNIRRPKSAESPISNLLDFEICYRRLNDEANFKEVKGEQKFRKTIVYDLNGTVFDGVSLGRTGSFEFNARIFPGCLQSLEYLGTAAGANDSFEFQSDGRPKQVTSKGYTVYSQTVPILQSLVGIWDNDEKLHEEFVEIDGKGFVPGVLLDEKSTSIIGTEIMPCEYHKYLYSYNYAFGPIIYKNNRLVGAQMQAAHLTYADDSPCQVKHCWTNFIKVRPSGHTPIKGLVLNLSEDFAYAKESEYNEIPNEGIYIPCSVLTLAQSLKEAVYDARYSGEVARPVYEFGVSRTVTESDFLQAV